MRPSNCCTAGTRSGPLLSEGPDGRAERGRLRGAFGPIAGQGSTAPPVVPGLTTSRTMTRRCSGLGRRAADAGRSSLRSCGSRVAWPRGWGRLRRQQPWASRSKGLTADEVRRYLTGPPGSGRRPGYVPLLPELPEGVKPLCTSRPRFACAGAFQPTVPRDDDLDWTILGLSMVESYGAALTTPGRLGGAWLDPASVHPEPSPAERAALPQPWVRGVAVNRAATVDNPYREWIGALIPGPEHLRLRPPGIARRRGAVRPWSTRGSATSANGIYGELWGGGNWCPAAFATTDAATRRCGRALAVVPPRLPSSRVAAGTARSGAVGGRSACGRSRPGSPRTSATTTGCTRSNKRGN